MLCYDLRSLDAKAISVDDTLPANDDVWEEGDALPLAPVQVHGRLS
jgi:hypothetical protein